MPLISVEVPKYDKLPKKLFGDAFELWLAPGGEGEVGRGFGYYFHDHQWWADGRHMVGFAREILHCLDPGSVSFIQRLTNKPKPRPHWLCGHGFQEYTGDRYRQSGTSFLYPAGHLTAMAGEALALLREADVTYDQWAASEDRQWLHAIEAHIERAHIANPFVAEHVASYGHLSAYIQQTNHANRIWHPAYPIKGPLNASGIGQTYCNSFLNAAFQAGTFTGAGTIYNALFSVTPSDTSLGTEAVYSGYGRQTITCNSTNFPNAAAGAIVYGVVITFPTNTGSAETEVSTAWCAASSGGTQPNWWGALAGSVVVNTNIAPQFNASAITTSGV